MINDRYPYRAVKVMSFDDGTETTRDVAGRFCDEWRSDEEATASIWARQAAHDRKGNRFTNSDGKSFSVTYRLFHGPRFILDTANRLEVADIEGTTFYYADADTVMVVMPNEGCASMKIRVTP
jgi:hypothetical protein